MSDGDPGAWLPRSGLRVWARALGTVAALALLLGCGHARTQGRHTWSATVVHVTDGDTLYVREPGDAVSTPVRVLGIDAPEICQRGGPEARQALAEQVLHQQVTLVGVGQDSYGRELARVYVRGQDMGRSLVSQGLAWSYRSGKDAGPYAREQSQARQSRLGVFAQARPEPPRAFRQRHGSCYIAH